MKKLHVSKVIYVSESKISNAGRGVFAKSKIKKGEIIERCPIIEIDKNDTANLNETILCTYFFYFGKNKDRVALTLGFGSIYNHSEKPNATFKILGKEGIIEFRAIKDIDKDEEITFDYRHGNRKKERLWFEQDSCKL